MEEPKSTNTNNIDSSMNSRKRAYFILILVVLLWGINWPIMKFALESIPPLTFGAIRMGVGSLVFFFILSITNRLSVPRLVDLRIVFSEGILHMAAPIGLMNLALLHVEAGKSAILSFTTTLWIAPFATLVLGEKMSRGKAAGLALGLIGIAILFNPFALDWGSTDVLVGNLLLMLAAFTWAIAILIARTHSWSLTPLQLVPWQLMLSSVLLFIPATVLESTSDIQWSWGLGLNLLFNGAVASGFCFWAALTVSRDLPSIEASIGFLGVPVAGVLFSALLLGEAVTISLATGLIFIIGGIAVVNFAEAQLFPKKLTTSARQATDPLD
ncbi:EamA family transporter (plasmid) [Roseibium aggregatum]|uniref:DMT family transporter n=1 Tax=Roseibium aggregatum TaxID=187304 RepID=UPI002B4B98AF|nr:DMT family transporter [Roseibium aggregatum]UES60089.1 EamA family transporter [Roseibium aggregatum]